MIEDFTSLLVEWIQQLHPLSIYTVFFAIAYLENIMPPIPGDVLVAFGGYMAAEGIIHIWPIYLLTTVASVIGFMSMYGIGYYGGYQLRINPSGPIRWLLYVVDEHYIEKARRWMNRWGQGVVLANRFLAGTRSVISLTAGISHTPVYKTVVSSTLSSMAWNAILLGFGWFVHQNWQVIGYYLSVYSRIILAMLVLIILLRWGYVRYWRGRRTNGNV